MSESKMCLKIRVHLACTNHVALKQCSKFKQENGSMLQESLITAMLISNI